MPSTVAVTHILLCSATDLHRLTARSHHQPNCCTDAVYNQHFHHAWRTLLLMPKTRKKHLATEQANLRLTMIALQDQKEHPSMQDKTYLYGILKDVSGYQQRSYAALLTELTWSRHQQVLSIHALETTSRLVKLQLSRHLRSPRSWNHQPLPLCRTQPHRLLHPQHLLLQTSHLYHRWSHPLLQRHRQSSLPHLSLPSPHQQHLHPHLCSDDQSEPSFHHNAWSQRRSSLLTDCCYWPGLPTDYDDSAPLTWDNRDDVSCQPIDHPWWCDCLTWRQPRWCVVPAHRPSVTMWLSLQWSHFDLSISAKVATLLPLGLSLVNKILAFWLSLWEGCYIISRTDTFVCVLPSTVTEGGNKIQQRILAFVLAKAQVTASTGKRGKYNNTPLVL